MAALSLTEIRDAFAEEPSADEHQYNTPIQQLPNHEKKSNPVNVRLVSDAIKPSRVTHRPRHSSSSRDAPTQRKPHHPDSAEMTRMVVNALTLTVGLAIHSFVVTALNRYFEYANMGLVNEMCVRIIYPCTVVFAVWALKKKS